MKSGIGFLFVVFCSLASSITPASSQGLSARVRQNIDEDWKFHPGNAADPAKDFNYRSDLIFAKTGRANLSPINPGFSDSEWRQLNIPHDWAVELPFVNSDDFNLNSHGYKAIGAHYPENSLGWYRKSLIIPASDSGNLFSLTFDGVFRDAKFWLNRTANIHFKENGVFIYTDVDKKSAAVNVEATGENAGPVNQKLSMRTILTDRSGSAGIDGVKQVDPAIKIMLHAALGGQHDETVLWIDQMMARGCSFDVLGLSFYPKWHGTLDDLKNNITKLIQRYPQPICIVEYLALKQEVNDLAFSEFSSRLMGTCIWEPLNTWEKVFDLDCFMIKPYDFDPSTKYPVIFNIYGEPAGSTVQDNWGGGDLYNQYLAQKGYIIMSVDNRGTKTPRGREWRKSIYRQIGILASKDQAAAAKAIMNKYPFVDSSRIGVYGWSGGGSMTLNCMFRYPEIYKTGIAVAFISNQKFYDTIYQERYMGLPDDNEEGYRDGSPVTWAKNLEGNLLLIHGSGDDNCHYQSCEVLADELIKQQKIFSMLEYPMRSHGIYEREGTSTQLRKTWTAYWLDKLPAGPR